MAGHAMDRLVADTAARMGWAEDEVRNFLAAVRPAPGEPLADAIARALVAAELVENRAAILALLRRMGRVMECHVEDGELAVRLAPGADVRAGPDGIRIVSPGTLQ